MHCYAKGIKFYVEDINCYAEGIKYYAEGIWPHQIF